MTIKKLTVSDFPLEIQANAESAEQLVEIVLLEKRLSEILICEADHERFLDFN